MTSETAQSSSIPLTDSHSHLSAEQFLDDRDAVLARCEDVGMRVVLSGDNLADSTDAVALAATRPWLFATVGLHPNETIHEQWNEEAYAALLNRERVVGIGEIGLDYYYLNPDDNEGKQRQWNALQEQLAFAQSRHYPVVLHCRDAYDDMLSMLKDFSGIACMMHTFVGDAATAQSFLEFGAYVSISGVVTFPNALRVRDAAQSIPLDRLLIETDAPFLAPVPYRGNRNEPAYVRVVAEKVAEIKGVPVQDIITATSQNAARFFRIA